MDVMTSDYYADEYTVTAKHRRTGRVERVETDLDYDGAADWVGILSGRDTVAIVGRPNGWANSRTRAEHLSPVFDDQGHGIAVVEHTPQGFEDHHVYVVADDRDHDRRRRAHMVPPYTVAQPMVCSYAADAERWARARTRVMTESVDDMMARLAER